MKRGESGLSLVVAVDKPTGMSSHDVVNRCRCIFGEKRVGHTGTLDPLATGVLPICVGPATRLGAYMTSHDKHYVVQVVFGASTDTDDCQGSVLAEGAIPAELYDEQVACAYVASLVGKHRQLPPVYSAIKVDGVKACDAARKGRIIDLTPRDIEVFSAQLVGMEEVRVSLPVSTEAQVGQDVAANNDERLSVDAEAEAETGEGSGSQICEFTALAWNVAFHVSKGTYIRSLARDMGHALGSPAHVGALRRTRVGLLGLDECVSLETLERLGEQAALDPVLLLGMRMIFLDEEQEKRAMNGGALSPRTTRVFERRAVSPQAEFCACTSGVCESALALQEGEMLAAIARNKLVALYQYEGERGRLKPCCVFQTGVSRGADI